MSLDWSVKDVHDYLNLCYVEWEGEGEPPPSQPGWFQSKEDAKWLRVSFITEVLVFSTMSVGMGEITEKNWSEFYARTYLVSLIHGGPLIHEGESRALTAEEVRSHIGLRTNVFPNESRSKFLKRLLDIKLDDWKRSAERECREPSGSK